jgi:phosphoglycolate phosphatase
VTAPSIHAGRGIRAIAFDFDGVLVDSFGAKRAAYDDVFGRYPAHRPALAALRDADASANRVVFFRRVLAGVFGDPGDEGRFEELMSGLSAAMVARVSACPAGRGARALLDALAGTPVHVVSLTPQEDLERIIRARGWAPLVRGVFGAPPWEKADALRAIVAREGLRSGSELLFVGDSASDEIAARQADVRFARLGPADASGTLHFEDLVAVNVWLHSADEVAAG